MTTLIIELAVAAISIAIGEIYIAKAKKKWTAISNNNSN